MNSLRLLLYLMSLVVGCQLRAQTLINVDFGGVTNSSQVGPAAVGFGSNDFWNAFSHYSPRFLPSAPVQPNGHLEGLRCADGTLSSVSIATTNAPGVWGNASGIPFHDSYIFAPNGSNLTVVVRGLSAGRYHFFLYGHAEADGTPEQNTVFTLRTGGPNPRVLGPLTSSAVGGWKTGQPWQEGRQYVVFRDIAIGEGEAVTIEGAPGSGGVAVLNGLQVLSRGSGPPRPELAFPDPTAGESTNLMIHAVRYQGEVRSGEARFQVEIEAEAFSAHAAPVRLFDGDLALIASDIPEDWRCVVERGQIRLHAGSPGLHTLRFELVARVTRTEPWDSIRFTGPDAAVATLDIHSPDADAMIQLVSGSPFEVPPSGETPGGRHLRGVVAGDSQVAVRWQSRAAEVARDAVMTVETAVQTVASPSVIRTTSTMAYEVVQGRVSTFTLQLPAGLALTRLTGEGVRDWALSDANSNSIVTVEMVRPVKGSASLVLVTEQSVSQLPSSVTVSVPRPLGVQRESGIWTLSRDEVDGQILGSTGLRQINARTNEWAAYRFTADPSAIQVELSPVIPRLTVSDRASAVLEETRILYRHALALSVSQAALYELAAEIPTGWSVAAVSGDGVSDWQVQGRMVRIHLAQRLLGERELSVQLEQILSGSARDLVLAPIRFRGAAVETAQINAAAVPGLNLRTSTLDGIREQPVRLQQNASNNSIPEAQLAYQSEGADWRITLATERLSPRLVAEVFNLITVGDGLVGGSATLRYAILNQGVQSFQVRLPRHWRNIEFTGANIRRTDHQDDLWTVALQDKTWGAYTLVLTYDYAFDPQNATLDGAGAHPMDVERETGTVAVTAAPGVQVRANAIPPPLRSLDPTELTSTDRALIARPVLLAYRYEGTHYTLGLQVTRHEQIGVLDAIADRTQLTSVLTEQGEMLTQATFLVKNNERQYQRFQLPPDAALWGVAVNGEAAKADRDGDWVLVTLPTAADRDQVFAVDLNYAQQFGKLARAGGLLARKITLTAPQTDLPGTYAQWELYTPSDRYVGGFGGNMSRPPGTDYGVRDAWKQFLSTYQVFFSKYYLEGISLIVVGVWIWLALQFFIRRLRWKGWVNLTLALVLTLIPFGVLLQPDLQGLWERGILGRGLHEFSAEKVPEAEATVGKAIEERKSDAPSTPPPSANGQEGPVGFLAAGGKMAVPAVNGVVPPPAALPAPSNLPTATGLRSLKIEIPRTGRASSFTRVLNLNGEPAQLQFSLISARFHAIRNFVVQLLAVAIGWFWTRHEWRSAHTGSGTLAMAVALLLAGAMSFLLSLRVLHVILILIPPTALGLTARIAWRKWASRQSPGGPPEPPSDGLPVPPSAPAPLEPAAIGVVLWVALGLSIGAFSPVAAAQSVPLAGVVQMDVVGAAGEQSARFEATLDLSSAGTNQVVDLFGPDTAIEEFASTNKEFRLSRIAGRAAVLMPNPGRSTVHVRWLVNVGGDASRRTLETSLPVSAGTHLRLTLAETDATVEFPAALSLHRTSKGEQTQVDAVLGATNRFTLAWKPRQSRVSAPPTVLLAEQASLAVLGNGAVALRTVIQFSAPQGEAQSFRIAVPASQRLVRVTGETVRTWDFSPNLRSEITVELTQPSASARVVVETEQNLPALPASVRLMVPVPVEVKRTTGWIALRPGEELGLSVERNGGLDRVEPSVLVPLLGSDVGPVLSTWRFLDASFDLGLKVELLTPRIEVVLHHQFGVGFEQILGNVHGDFTISRAGIFALRLALPNDLRILQVQSPGMASFAEHQTATGRELEIVLQQRTLGALPVDVVFSRSLTNLPGSLTLTGLTAPGAARASGFVSVSTEAGINLTATAFPGLAEIPASALPKGGAALVGGLAFKRLPGETAAGPDWSLTLATETVDSWVRAETATFVTVGESFASGRALVRYDIQNAPVKEFILRVPSDWRNVEISGAGIRRRDQTNRAGGVDWRIELQNKVRGDFRLQLKWEQLRDQTHQFATSGLEVLGAERETGSIAFFTQGQVQLMPPTMTNGLLRIDAREWPDWAAPGSHDPARLSFRYLRPGWQMTFEVRQYQDAALLQALIEKARIRTVVADGGQMMTQMELHVRNNGRQNLELTLPPGAEVWSSFVNREPVRPARDQGQILIPLEGSDTSLAAVEVELTYVLRGDFPRKRGRVELSSARAGLPLKDAQWEVFLPPEYHYSDFGGSMSFQPGDAIPAVLDYTLDTYQRQQAEEDAARKAAESELLSQTRRELAANDARGLSKLGRFSWFSASSSVAGDNRALKELKDAFSEAQSSNLIEAQQGYEMDNQLRLNQDKPAASRAYDAKVARQQVAQLNRAQSVVTTRVSPLHVNLPTYGLRYSFNQVLQTQPGEPLTVSFHVRNERHPGWVRKVIQWGVALGILWVISATVLALRPEPRPRT